jgi:hypothetical protein
MYPATPSLTGMFPIKTPAIITSLPFNVAGGKRVSRADLAPLFAPLHPCHSIDAATVTDLDHLDRVVDQLWLNTNTERPQLDDPRVTAAIYSEFQQRAFDLVRSPSIQRVFGLDQEAPAVRDHGGRHIHGPSL